MISPNTTNSTEALTINVTVVDPECVADLLRLNEGPERNQFANLALQLGESQKGTLYLFGKVECPLFSSKALQEYPSSDAYIQNFLHEQWTQIEDEVHEPYVGQRLAEMADVAGPRHRAEVMNYVLKLSERMTPVEDFHDLEMKESWHLKTAVEKLWARGPVSIGEVTEILQDGNSMQRLGAIAVLTRILQPFPERVKEGGTNTHEPKTVSWSALASALIAAANDEKPEVRMFAVWLAPASARLSPDTNDALRNQLKKMIAIDSDPRLREHAALLLQD